MGHRYYIWAIPKSERLPFIGEEIKRAFELAVPRFRNSQSPLVFRELNYDENKSIFSFQIVRSIRRRERDYDRKLDKFTIVYRPYWREFLCFWDVKRNYIEIRGGKSVQEDIFNELVSIFKPYFDFVPLQLSDKSFEYVVKERISNVTEKEYYVEGGYVKVGGICLSTKEFEAFQQSLRKKSQRGIIGGLYSIPGTLIVESIIKVPVFLDQAGKIRFFRFQETKEKDEKEFYETITRKIVEDILSIIIKLDKVEKNANRNKK